MVLPQDFVDSSLSYLQKKVLSTAVPLSKEQAVVVLADWERIVPAPLTVRLDDIIIMSPHHEYLRLSFDLPQNEPANKSTTGQLSGRVNLNTSLPLAPQSTVTTTPSLFLHRKELSNVVQEVFKNNSQAESEGFLLAVHRILDEMIHEGSFWDVSKDGDLNEVTLAKKALMIVRHRLTRFDTMGWFELMGFKIQVYTTMDSQTSFSREELMIRPGETLAGLNAKLNQCEASTFAQHASDLRNCLDQELAAISENAATPKIAHDANDLRHDMDQAFGRSNADNATWLYQFVLPWALPQMLEGKPIADDKDYAALVGEARRLEMETGGLQLPLFFRRWQQTVTNVKAAVSCMKKTSARLSKFQAHASNATDSVSEATSTEAPAEAGLQPIIRNEPSDLDYGHDGYDDLGFGFDWSQLDEMQHHWWRPL